MNVLSLFWANNRRWLVPALLVVGLLALLLTFAQTTNFLTGWLAQRQGVKRSSEIVKANDTRHAADQSQQKTADKELNILEGKGQSAHAASQQSKKAYEKATAELPVITELPRNPPRFRPGGR